MKKHKWTPAPWKNQYIIGAGNQISAPLWKVMDNFKHDVFGEIYTFPDQEMYSKVLLSY